jgi:hypothetical protein
MMKKWWWLFGFAVALWSPEERRARAVLFITALVVFFILYIPEVSILLTVGVEEHVATLICVFTAVVPAFFAARPVCAWLWPEMLRKGDENAAKRWAGPWWQKR